MHVWLTSPACEVLDATLFSTTAIATKTPGLAGHVNYRSRNAGNPRVTYHPTVIGKEFRDKVGFAFSL